MLDYIFLLLFLRVLVSGTGEISCSLTFPPPGSDLGLSLPQIEKIMTLIGAGIELSRDQHYATPGEVTSSQARRRTFILYNKQIVSVFRKEEQNTYSLLKKK